MPVFAYVFVFFFSKEKTAYDMRIRDWSSDVCSSDLAVSTVRFAVAVEVVAHRNDVISGLLDRHADLHIARMRHRHVDAVEPFALFEIAFVGIVDLDAQRARMRLEPTYIDEDGGGVLVAQIV